MMIRKIEYRSVIICWLQNLMLLLSHIFLRIIKLLEYQLLLAADMIMVPTVKATSLDSC
jgi:hypothetical protein